MKILKPESRASDNTNEEVTNMSVITIKMKKLGKEEFLSFIDPEEDIEMWRPLFTNSVKDLNTYTFIFYRQPNTFFFILNDFCL